MAIADHQCSNLSMRPDLPSSLVVQRFLIRARQYRAQAILLADMEGFEPNWPKYFLLTHAIELAINAFLVFEPGTRGGSKKPENHDLMELYEEAVRRGLKCDALVLKDLPHLSELHKLHYARYPRIEAKPVALISQFDDMVEQLFADVRQALGVFGR